MQSGLLGGRRGQRKMQRRRLQRNVRPLFCRRKCRSRGLELCALRRCRGWLRGLRLSCESRGKPRVQPHGGYAKKKTRDSSDRENRRAAQNFLQKSTLTGCYPAPIGACQLLAVISPSFASVFKPQTLNTGVALRLRSGQAPSASLRAGSRGRLFRHVLHPH